MRGVLGEDFSFDLRVLLLEGLPERIDPLLASLLQHGPAAARVPRDHPPDVMADGQEQFDEHLGGAVEGDDDEHDFAVVVGTHAGLVGDHHIHVDAHVGQDGVPEQPESADSYQEDTKNTLSF